MPVEVTITLPEPIVQNARLFGGATQQEIAGALKPIDAADAAVMMAYAERVAIVPGYGMAVAQAQHKIWEFAKLLIERGVKVKFAIHPVAGRMPGHMNVLLAEAGVPYDLIEDMDDINPEFPNIDVALEELPSSEIVRGVAGGLADIGIVADAVDPAAELETFPFAEDRLVLVVPERHPLARRRRIAFADALSHDFVGLPVGSALQDHIDGQAARAGHRLKLRVRLSGFDAVCRMVEVGIGLAVVSKIAAARCRRSMAIRVVPLTDAWALRHLQICVKSLRRLPVHAQSLVEHLRFA